MKQWINNIRIWMRCQWEKIRPSRTAWNGAALGLIIGGFLFWVITQLFTIVPGMLIWVILLFLLLPPTLFFLAAGLIHSLLTWLNNWPKNFRLALMAGLGLFALPFVLMVRFELPAVIGTIVLVICTSVIGAAAAVMKKTGWSGLTKLRQVFFVLGVVLAVGIFSYCMLWLIIPGGSIPQITNAAQVNMDQVQALDLPDPSLPGTYTVERLTYGSGEDLRRPEYGSAVNLVSRSVDASAFVQGWEGFAGWALRQYWGFDLDSLPLNGRVWYPQGDGAYPLVLVVHGNHRQEDFSDPGYAYLGEHLASHGMIVVSVDQNFLNGTWTGIFNGKETKNENDARAWMLLEHLRLWKQWNQKADHPFYKKVDWEKLVLIGHSRGGEAVAEAAFFNQLPTYPDNAKIKFNYNYPIQAVIAIAPIDSQYDPGGWRTPMSGVNYLVLHGSLDGDVTSFDGMAQYNRTSFSLDSDQFKAAVYIHGANHGQFNSNWGNSDSGPGLGAAFWNTKAMMSSDEQERTAKVFISAFLQAALKDQVGYRSLFRDWRTGADWLPETIYLTQYQDARFLVVANFEEDLNTSTATIEGAEIFTGYLNEWKEGKFRGKWSQDLSTSLVQFGWDQQTNTSLTPFYGINLKANSLHITSQDYFVFSMGDAGTSSEEEENELHPQDDDQNGINFSIELSSAQNKAVITLNEVMLLQPQIKVELAKAGFLDGGETSETVLQRFYIPLSLFLADNPNFEPTTVDKIRFCFDQTLSGKVVLDEIGFWQSPVE